MKIDLKQLALIAGALLVTLACSGPLEEPKDNNDDNGTVEQPKDEYADLKAGLTVVPEIPNADDSVTFYYKANMTSPLYNSSSDLYFYTGVWYASDDWRYVPANWGVNTDKCKMEKLADNVWKLDMKPSIREWFDSDTTGIWYIGIVIRNAAGNKQTTPDFIIETVDDKYAFDTFTPVVVNESMPAGLEYGINYLSDTSVGLVFYDKDTEGKGHDYCYVIGEFSGWERDHAYSMKRDEQAGCWWYIFENLEPGKEYMFQYWLNDLSGKNKVLTHDPYTEIVYDKWNDQYIPSSTYPSLSAFPDKTSGLVSAFQTARPEYAWQVTDFKIEDKNDLIIYELLLREFTRNGDKEGNLRLAMEKLDYLAGLGVNAIELMPVQEFDGNDSWGYNPCSFFALDKAYGTREDYKMFIDECHKRGIAVFFDVVYNHATGSFPLAKLYWNGDATAENNPWFNVVAKHDYNVYHDMNHESEFVRNYVKRNLIYLLDEYNIDGFRFDLTKGFTQKNTLGNTNAWGQLDESRVTILTDYAGTIWKHNPDAVVIFEHLSDRPEEKRLAEFGQEYGNGIKLWNNQNHAFCEGAMGWQSSCDFSGLWTGQSMPFGSLVGYMESHDEERMGYKQTQWGNGEAKTDLSMRMKRLEQNAAFFLLVPGPKMIWQFGELGFETSINDPDRVAMKLPHWEYLDVPERKGLYDAYAELITFRRTYPEFFDDDATFTQRVSSANWKDRQISCIDAEGRAFTVVGNFDVAAAESTFNLPVEGAWREYGAEDATVTNGSSITLNLSPAEYRILVNFE